MTKTTFRRRADALKKKWPAYAPLLALYVAVREAQSSSTPRMAGPMQGAIPFAGGTTEAQQGGPLFIIDVPAARVLFDELCVIGKTANAYFATHVSNIEDSLSQGSLDLDTLLATGATSDAVQTAAENAGLDVTILSFLISESRRPSIEQARKELMVDFDFESWQRPVCPACGGVPELTVFKGDPVQRISSCVDCGCEWPVPRLSCAICGSDEKDVSAYLHGEGQDGQRIDTCDSCHHFVKTIDLTKIDVEDPLLEDLATRHLDVFATEKGFSRAARNPWGS